MKRLGDPPYVCLITEGNANPENYEIEKPRILETLRAAISDGVKLIQIREKDLSARLMTDLASAAASMAESRDLVIVVNDRADVAAASGAAGVHLPETSLPPQTVRREFPRIVIGVSTHTLEGARAAAENGADYVFFGPVFETPGKSSLTGIKLLEQVCQQLGEFPVIALGGVDETNFAQALSAGAAGIAAIRSLNNADSRRQICRAINTV